MINELVNLYGNKIRVRVCGILENQNRFLMINHTGLNDDDIFWNFPGGGVEKKESLVEALTREFREETHLSIYIENLICINEYIKKPLHALEFYFKVNTLNHEVTLGYDPEINIISKYKWFSKEELLNLPTNHKASFLNEKFDFQTFENTNSTIQILKND